MESQNPWEQRKSSPLVEKGIHSLALISCSDFMSRDVLLYSLPSPVVLVFVSKFSPARSSILKSLSQVLTSSSLVKR